MDSINEMLANMTPWGLTLGQTAVVLIFAAGLMVLLMVVGAVFRLAGRIMRVGCALVFVLICGCTTMFIFSNIVNRR
ncbi:MAG TPA: hypothetical protein PLD47_16950 [Aggregatilineales bacterium]|nr:hypothetical protein [Anaerolineales bacterium]HRE49416.1 hypothetical protein [Aggregatilineales bacterium]